MPVETCSNKSNHYLIFTIEKVRYAISVPAVERICSVVNITPLPKVPDILQGIIKMKGLIVPVINVRKRLGIPDREPELSDHMIILRTEKLTLAMPVDEVTGLMELDITDIEKKDNIFPGLKYIEGVIKSSPGIIIVHNPDEFLTPEEEENLAHVTGEKNEYFRRSSQKIEQADT